MRTPLISAYPELYTLLGQSGLRYKALSQKFKNTQNINIKYDLITVFQT